jgi:hypothetical protein
VPYRQKSVVSHSVQEPPFGPWYPALQTQKVCAADPDGLPELALQGRQPPDDARSTVVLYVSLAQARQVSEPGMPSPVEYLPAPQFRQSVSRVLVVPGWYVPALH